MKKILFTIVALLAVCGSANAVELHFGAKAGLNLTNLIGDDAPHGVQFNYQAGAFVEAKLTENFGIAPEVVFSAQGGKKTFDKSTTVGSLISDAADINWNTNYVNVPIMLKYYVTDGLSLDFGPQIGFNVSSDWKTKIKDNELPNVDLKDATKDVDFALGLGATYYLTQNFFLQARYTISLTKVCDDVEADGYKVSADARHGVGQISVGFQF